MFLAKTGRTLVNQMSTYTTRQSSRDPSTMAKVALVLEDGSVFFGKSFGAPIKEKSLGEAVFQTGMVGYAEALTDPSYRGQLLAMTFPMIGNYGVPAYAEDENGLPVKTFESKHIHASALIVQEYSAVYSHWEANRSLGEWLAEENVPGICEVDTRRLAKLLRERGSMLGAIVPHAESETALKKLAPQLAKEAKEYLATRHLVDEVSCTDSPRIYKPTNTQEKARVLAIDCGIKANMVRELNKRGVQVTVLRWNEAWATNGLMDQYDGVFLSNGPGDPTACDATIAQIKSALSRADPTTVRPIFGICLGNQLVGLAAGAETKKLRFGNRGQNQPCIDAKNGECFVTSQNHGYAVDDTKLPTGWSTLYTNANDGSNEGLIHDSLPYFTAQFHPEANGGPNDAAFLFDVFVDACINYRQVRQGIIMETKFPALRFENSLHAVQPMKQSHEFPKKVLLLGSGGLSIGQAGEFDYSGAQAIKALKEEGVEVVLMNPNIASVQTNVDPSSTAAQRRADPSAADHVFFIPVTPAFVEQVIIREKPDAILISMGGQTALNCGIELHNKGIFAKYGVRVLGTQIDAVVATEDREIFKNELAKIGEPVATSVAVTSVKDALEAAENVTGYPCMARAAFALGGLGSGIVQDAEQLEKLARKALAVSPQLLIEKSMLGWKEVEYEVVRDSADNCITVCNMENFDPLGVHTGDSIVVAPSQTLTNREYFKLRATALKVVRHLGIIGECNIQYALNPKSEDACIIEVNARLSRSSALASKATGFPLAYVATKLSLGHDLVSIRNSVTQTTTACFEPSLDYCVVKVPRWDMRKFQRVSTRLGSAMKSVGEVMAIGRSFEEAIQKAVRMVNPNLPGLEGFAASGNEFDNNDDDHLSGAQSSSGISIQGLEQRLKQPNDQRLFAVQLAFEKGYSIDKVHELTKIDRWFLAKLRRIARLRVAVETRFAQQVTENHNTLMRSSVGSGGISASIEALGYDAMRKLKQAGFSDAQIASYARCTEARVRRARLALGVKPAVKQIDTLGGEVPARTNYLYMTYHGDEADVVQSERAVIVLGCGAYCIGSSVEFDWSAVSCVRQCRASGYRAIVVNCNPETVSTDYDVSDRLYFEELSLERVLDVYDREGVDVGVVVSMGGQIPQNLAVPLDKAGAHVLGTRPAMIDAAEDRSKFSALMDKAGVKQPRWAELESEEAAITFAKSVGYPVLVRPSYVLSGAAMAVCRDEQGLLDHLHKAKDVSKEHPVVVSKFVRGARELEVDAVAKDGQVICAALHEHIEDAGVHSGDATLMLPPQTLSAYALQRARDATREIAKSLQISGPLNVQFLIGGREGPPGSNELDGSFESMNAVRVIECNLRASRSVPFVSKSTGVDFADVATRVLAGYPVAPTDPDHPLPPLYPSSTEHIRPKNFVAVKAPMFSFARLRGADPTLGVEMASTGEVACFGADAHEAFLKAYLSTNTKLPKKGDAVLLSFAAPYAHRALAPAYQLYELGYRLYATQNTADYLNQRSVPCEKVAFPTDESTQDALDAAEVLKDGSVRLVVNLHSPESQRLADNYLIRRTAADYHIALITNTQLFETLAIALARHNHGDFLALKPASLFHHYKMEKNEDAWTDVDEFH
mmetsp:Transcript_16399/g.24619  ORF Transcript_16399/g.24619 Transcript_16399/m.24619 type:complete len:1619 (-) Transcript_16399:529-5385(-)